MKQSYRNLVSDSLVFAVGNMLVKLIQFFLLPMYTAYLTTEQYGVGELVNNMAELLYPLACLGIYEGVFRYSVDRGVDQRTIFSTGISITVAGIPVVAAAGVLGYAVTGFDYTWSLVVLSLAMSFRMTCLQFAKGLGRIKLYAASGVIGAIVLCLLGFIFLACLGAGVNGYLCALIVSQVVQLVIIFVGAKMWRYVSLRMIDRNLLRELLVYSLPMIPNSLAWWFVNLSGRYIVLFSSDVSMAGLYVAASKLPAVMNMFLTIFQQSWQIFSAREYNSRDRNISFGVVFRVYSALLLCIGSFVVAVTAPFCSIMLSGEFFEAYIYVPALMLGAVINGYSTYFGTLYNAAKCNGMIFVTTVIGACVNVTVGIVLSFFIGPWGPIVGAVVGYSVISLSRIFDTRRLADIEICVPYQLMGLGVISVEVIAIIVGGPDVTVPCIVLSLAFCAFTVAKYRSLLMRVFGGVVSAIKGRGAGRG